MRTTALRPRIAQRDAGGRTRFRDMSRWEFRGSSLAFVRLISHPTLLEHPLTVREAEACVRQWLDCDHVRLLVPRETTLKRFFSLLDEAGLGGNLATDALIAAHAEEYGATVHSTDRDFDRFTAVRWINPLKR